MHVPAKAGPYTLGDEMKRILVRATGGSYDVIVGLGVLTDLRRNLRALGECTGVFVLSSPRVWKHHGRSVLRGLGPGASRRLILFDDAEAAKNVHTCVKIWRELVRRGADRRALILAVGGGVVGDVAGFVAATYMRGVRLVHVPTTLVAQVDSAIGGKTGVNLPEGKNLVGAFYQPSLVVADSDVLRTLPVRQFRSGLYEVVKYGVLGDAQLFAYLEENMANISPTATRHLQWIIPRCVAAKARIVERDEREAGLREVLNLGHTFAHALETATEYRYFLHGEAVGWGLMAAAELAQRMKMLTRAEAGRIVALVRAAGKLPAWPAVAPAKLLGLMRGDKKARGGKVRFVLPTAIGKVRIGVEAPERVVGDVLGDMRSDH